jgi:GNAT superfamily N-acetyltransferase
MSSIQIREMTAHDERFVASCTHVGETEEWDASCRRRIPWLREMVEQGMRVKVALLDGEHAGFLYLLPIEIAPAGPVGRDLSVIQCLAVKNELKGHGVGHALIAAAEEEAQKQGRKGIVVTGFYHDFWFMPAPFFEECGFTVAARRGNAALLWKTFDDRAQPPLFMVRRYRWTPVEGAVVIDLFWSRSCLTTDTEAQRVREVAAEFGDAVLLREHCADDPAVRARYGIYRAIYIDGQEIGWGYEAPRDGLRAAIREAMGLRRNDS